MASTKSVGKSSMPSKNYYPHPQLGYPPNSINSTLPPIFSITYYPLISTNQHQEKPFGSLSMRASTHTLATTLPHMNQYLKTILHGSIAGTGRPKPIHFTLLQTRTPKAPRTDSDLSKRCSSPIHSGLPQTQSASSPSNATRRQSLVRTPRPRQR